ncbi:MAG: hypothetical protein KDI13_02530 [Alphaproteobacteria bacterium]|nr:hypothetical protein [Alphaproteobacteria bacterium]
MSFPDNHIKRVGPDFSSKTRQVKPVVPVTVIVNPGENLPASPAPSPKKSEAGQDPTGEDCGVIYTKGGIEPILRETLGIHEVA